MSGIGGITLKGMEALPVEVEVEITQGMFSVSIVGMADTAVKESRERVRAALRSLGRNLRGRISVNLAPADIPKEGALLDLPIALGMLKATGDLTNCPRALYMGELALDGRLRRVRGAVPAAFLAKKLNIPLYVPSENSEEVALVKGVEAYCADSLAELVEMLSGVEKPRPVIPAYIPETLPNVDSDFEDIKGQLIARRAAEIAAAGHHNLLLVGSPGSGKTLIARSIAGILPPLTDDELVETLLVRSTLGMETKPTRERPFRIVHFTASTVSVCGGGNNLRPGEVSLAHRGVLFLDEYTEFRRDLTESLRAPIEDGFITVSRATGTVTYPSRVLLILAANPCACGYYGDPTTKCTCSATDLERYKRKLSGPIMDRIDLKIEVPRLTPEELLSFDNRGKKPESSAVIRERVIKARKIQQERWKEFNLTCNAELPEKLVKRYLTLSDENRKFLADMAEKFNLSGRGLSRVLKVSRTIADLAGEEEILKKHLAEALMYRQNK
ncbi:MAG: YifB family Mg chelatase-like AAA ATPase [Synergistaceae bacterium]|nr:YifB family Mg chelatase-like AAA ATPase [Synergistaceae bacterium]MBR0079964.1 YifB family Mg chelatase-like AAA ATPase [Synergistaceae bacterium]